MFKMGFSATLLSSVEIFFDVRGSVHHSIVHIKKSNKLQQNIKILFHIYIKLNMFRTTRRPPSGA